MESVLLQQMLYNHEPTRPVQQEVVHPTVMSSSSFNRQLELLSAEFFKVARLYSTALEKNHQFADYSFQSAIQLYNMALALRKQEEESEEDASNPLIYSLLAQASSGFVLANQFGRKLPDDQAFQFNLFYATRLFEETRDAADCCSHYKEGIAKHYKQVIEMLGDLFSIKGTVQNQTLACEALSHLCEAHEFFGYYLLKCGKVEEGIFHLTQFLNTYDRIVERQGELHYTIDMHYVYIELSKAYEKKGDLEESSHYRAEALHLPPVNLKLGD